MAAASAASKDKSGKESDEARLLLEHEAETLEELKDQEDKIYDLETMYIEDAGHATGLLHGWEQYLESGKSVSAAKNKRVPDSDRIFSVSSASAPVQRDVSAYGHVGGYNDGFDVGHAEPYRGAGAGAGAGGDSDDDDDGYGGGGGKPTGQRKHRKKRRRDDE